MAISFSKGMTFTVLATCPPGFTYLPPTGSCYKVVYENHNWTEAAKTCQALYCGSHMVAITSETENSALQTFLTSEISSMHPTTAIMLAR